MKPFSLLAVVGLALVAGCSTVIPLDELRPPAPSQGVVELGRGFSTTWRTAQVRLIPGNYAPVAQNEKGVFYRGPSGCLVVTHEDGTVQTSEGGFWLPTGKDDAILPRYFVYTGTMKTYKKGIAVAPSDYDPTLATAVQGIVLSPVPVSPAVAGLGAGIAAGIVGALATVDTSRITFVFDPMSRATLEAAFVVR